MFENFSSYWQDTLNWEPSTQQAELLEQLYKLVLEGNQIHNLTRITEPTDFWEKHIWDSLRGVLPLWQQENLRVVDIGTGGGFPGLPVAIAQPNWQLTLLDSKRKKIDFVHSAVTAMQLPNVKAEAVRAEEIKRHGDYWKSFDLALIRAVGKADQCAQYALPFLASGGQAVLYRGQWTASEEADLSKACLQLNAAIKQVDACTTPISQSIRHCVYLMKQ